MKPGKPPDRMGTGGAGRPSGAGGGIIQCGIPPAFSGEALPKSETLGASVFSFSTFYFPYPGIGWHEGGLRFESCGSYDV
jgi:hypothetical protein